MIVASTTHIRTLKCNYCTKLRCTYQQNHCKRFCYQRHDHHSICTFHCLLPLCRCSGDIPFLTPDDFEKHLIEILEEVRKKLPRTFVNLIPLFNISQVSTCVRACVCRVCACVLWACVCAHVYACMWCAHTLVCGCIFDHVTKCATVYVHACGCGVGRPYCM